MKESWNRGYLTGILCIVSGIGLWQDVLGVDRYCRLVRDGWMDSAISVPIEIVMLIIALILWMKK